MKNPYTCLVGSSEGKRQLWRSRRKCTGNIKMDLKGIGYEGARWIHVAQDAVQ